MAGSDAPCVTILLPPRLVTATSLCLTFTSAYFPLRLFRTVPAVCRSLCCVRRCPPSLAVSSAARFHPTQREATGCCTDTADDSSPLPRYHLTSSPSIARLADARRVRRRFILRVEPEIAHLQYLGGGDSARRTSQHQLKDVGPDDSPYYAFIPVFVGAVTPDAPLKWSAGTAAASAGCFQSNSAELIPTGVTGLFHLTLTLATPSANPWKSSARYLGFLSARDGRWHGTADHQR